MQELYSRYRRNDPFDSEASDIESAIGRGDTIIPLPEGTKIMHPDYAVGESEVDGQIQRYLIRQRAAYAIQRDGSDDPDAGLEETTKAAIEHMEKVEAPKMDAGETDVHCSVLQDKIYGAHENYLVTKLVRGTGGNSDAYFNEEAIEKLGFKEDYVHDRLEAIAKVTLGKENLPKGEASLINLVEHVDATTTVEERLQGAAFEQCFCYAYSHWKIRDDYKPEEGEQLEASSSSPHVKEGIRRRQRKIRLDTLNPDVRHMEDEIVEHLGDDAHPDVRNLARTYINLRWILPEDKSKQLPTHPTREAYEHYNEVQGDRR